MDWQPIHEIKVEHTWEKKAERRALDFGGYSGIEECKDCGKSREYLSLSTKDDYHWDSLSREQQHAELRKMAERAVRTLELAEESERKQLENTRYRDYFDLIEDIDRKSQYLSSAGEMPVWQLQTWLRLPTKKIKRKVLLAFKQGLVCNRCDRIAFSLDNLTVDHIRPKSDGGGEELTNLQLLCSRCNEEKADKGPNESDISPFNPNAQQCIHHVTCVELDDLSRTFEVN